MIAGISLGVSLIILLIAMFFISLRKVKKISLADRIYNRGLDTSAVNQVEKDDDYLDRLSKDLLQAKTGITVPIYFLIMVVSAVAIFIVSYFLVESVILSVLACCIAVMIPRQVVNYLKDKRKQEFDVMFTKVLKRMSAVLKTNATMLQAVEEIINSESLPMVIREEYAQVLADYQITGSMSTAFSYMYERTGSSDVSAVAMALEINNRYGSNLHEVFTNYASAIMERKEMEAEGRATLSNTKSSANIMCALPFVFGAGMKFVQPDYFDVLFSWENGAGKLIILGFYLIVVFGFFYLRKKCDVRL